MGRSKRKATQISQITTTATISDLPNHITSDILSRLPLSSVFACKRVCKPWRDLTLEPCFAKSRLSRYPPSLVFYRIGTKSPSHFEILQLYDPPALCHPTTTVKFKTEINSPRMLTELVASCNGSILLSNSSCNDVIVFNLLMAQRIVLPKPPKSAPKAHNFVSLGFGYSPSTDRYKVLRLTYTPGPARLCCDIYTIGIDDRWRSTGDTGQPPAFIISQIILLNGVLHWIGDGNSRFIYYFDVEKEHFGSFPLPSHIESSCDCLGVVDNRLYLHDELSVDEWKVWTMKDYGDFGSWTLEWVIERPITNRFGGSHKPLKTFRDGSLLMMFSGLCPRINVMKTTLASYNPQTKVLEEIKYRGVVLLWGASIVDVPCFCSPMDALK